MYKKKYYEVIPNIELVTNQSQSFFYPVSTSISNSLLQSYNYDVDKDDDIDINSGLNFKSEELNEVVDIHELLDYASLYDECLINIQMLFSKKPTNKEEDNNIVQYIRSRGILPRDAIIKKEN